MKINSPYLAVFSVGLFLLVAGNVFAQDDLPTNYQEQNLQELNLHEDKTLIYEAAEGKSLSAQGIAKDTIKIAPATAKEKASDLRKPEAQTEDALSFNFLYYMFRKFKIADIVEQ